MNSRKNFVELKFASKITTYKQKQFE